MSHVAESSLFVSIITSANRRSRPGQFEETLAGLLSTSLRYPEKCLNYISSAVSLKQLVREQAMDIGTEAYTEICLAGVSGKSRT